MIKARLYTTPQQAIAFAKLSRRYRLACDDISQFYFEQGMNLSRSKLHKLCYHYVRGHFKLKSQLAESVFATVLARYKSVDTQMREHVYHYRDNYDKQWYHCYKNKYWLYNPIRFRRPQADLVVGRDWSLVNHCQQLSINTLGKRTKCNYYLPKYFRKYLKVPHKLGTSKLLPVGEHWYLHISCTVSVPNFNWHTQSKNVVGIDRGLRFLIATYDSHKHSKFVSGLHIMKKREHFLHKRTELQAKGTKSAKRKLVKMSGRENRWMTNINHQISKALVHWYPKHTTFVLEDLRGVRFSTEQVPKGLRYTQVSWAFYQLEQFLRYKASFQHDTVIKINPQYTSQRCPSCGRVIGSSRRHKTHTYICKHCGYTSNDDRIGAMNIRYLGIKKIHGKTNPKIKPDKHVLTNINEPR